MVDGDTKTASAMGDTKVVRLPDTDDPRGPKGK